MATTHDLPRMLPSFYSNTSLVDSTSPTSPRSASTVHSSTSSSTNLPTLGFAHCPQSRQLRPPKNPLYVPAVLRPTEVPRKYRAQHRYSQSDVSSPITPPSSAENSFNAKDGSSMLSASRDRTKCLAPKQMDTSLSSGIVTRIVTDEWLEDAFEQVTGSPTRDHWKPDSSSDACNYPQCSSSFSFLNRRHHCRRCGNIFCAPHSTNAVPLDQHARFHPQGIRERACGNCWADYKMWDRARKSRSDSNGDSNSSTSSGTATPVGPPARMPNPKMVVGSVPREWNWSTF